MHPRLRRRLRPIAAVVLVFFSWFSIEPWNYALAAQDSPAARVNPASASQQKAPTAPEVFETNLRSIKEQVRAARDGDAYQAQLTGLLKSLDQAVVQSSRDLESTRQAVYRLALAIEHGAPSQDAIKALQTQQQTVKASVGQVRLNASGIEGLLRGMVLPAGLSKDQKQAKEAVTGLMKAFDATLTAMARRAEQQRGFDAQEHQAFLAASVELDQGLAALQARVQAVAKEATPERRRAQLWQEAFSQRDSLLSADRAIRKEFDQTEAFLKEKGLSQEILDRHAAAVNDYEKNFNQLKAYFGQVDKANRAYVSATERGNEPAAQAAERDLESKLMAFDDFLKANVKDPPHQPLDPNNLPHRTPKPTERKPRLKKEEFADFQTPIRLAFNGDPANLMLAQAASDLPTPEDLAETIEVQFTPKIQALAAELEHNPVRIYNWVRNNIDFVPTYGSIQGAHMCLLTKQCNDMDTASLLIALLRTSGIAARYVIGTIEVPIEQVKNWLGGFTDDRAVLKFIASAGTPVTGLVSGGQVSAARIEHVWVDAYVDLVPSRGAAHKSGDSWVPLDGSFKQTQSTRTVNLETDLPFDGNAFIDGLLTGATVGYDGFSIVGVDSVAIEGTLAARRTEVQTFLTDNAPTATLGEAFGVPTIHPKTLPLLPVVLPYRVLTVGARFGELAPSLRHTARIELRTVGETTADFSISLPLAQVVASRLTVAPMPETTADESVIQAYLENAATTLPAYLVRMRPELHVDGVSVASAPSHGIGTRQTLDVTLTSPAFGETRASHSVRVGDSSTIALNPGRVPAELVLDRIAAADFQTEPVGEVLYQTAQSYWAELDAFNRLTALQANVAVARQPSEVLATAVVSIREVLNVPFEATYRFRNLDVKVDQYAVQSKAGDAGREFSYFVLSGAYGSALEGVIFEQIFALGPGAGISTMALIQSAANAGIPIVAIDAANVDGTLPLLTLSSQVRSDIRSAANAGKQVLVPASNLSIGQWAGVGYVILDTVTGAAAYQISGGLSGGVADIGIALVIPVPEIPKGLPAKIASIIANNAGLVLESVETADGPALMLRMPIASFLRGPGPLPVPKTPTEIGLAVMIAVAVAVLSVLKSDTRQDDPKYGHFRHYTTFRAAQSIFQQRQIDPSESGTLGPGVYLTDIVRDPISMEDRQFIFDTLELPDFSKTESYVAIRVDKNKIRLFWRLDKPHEFLYQGDALREQIPTIVFLNWWQPPPN